MPVHTFVCANCTTPNHVQVQERCACHECERNRPLYRFHESMRCLIKAGAAAAIFGLLAIPGGCYISGVMENKKTETVRKIDADAALVKERQIQEIEIKRLDVEVRKMEAASKLRLDQFDVKPTVGPDGKVSVTLVPKEK